eukprot:COSAG05_NODE_77_length_21410_cov_1079.308573_20_plen_35_part_00
MPVPACVWLDHAMMHGKRDLDCGKLPACQSSQNK